MKKNFLIIDNQARGHSLARQLLLSNITGKVFLLRDHLLPNDTNKNIISLLTPDKKDPNFFKTLLEVCKNQQVDCVIIGTIDTMEKGLVDYLNEYNIITIGANKNAAKLEGSKLFAKEFMQKYNIPTPNHLELKDKEHLEEEIEEWLPCIIKSNRVIKGCYSAIQVSSRKQSIQCYHDIEHAQKELYKESSIFIEQLCNGKEYSFTVLLSESSWEALPTCQDHKQLHSTTTLNTGGMGSIAPAPDISSKDYNQTIENIIKPTINAINKEGLSYNGFLYFGIFIDQNKGPLLLELNCRIGDPEAQSIFMLASSNFAEKLYNTAKNNLKKTRVKWKSGVACSIYTVPVGYPEACKENQIVHIPSENLDNINNIECSLGAVKFSEETNQWLSHNNRIFCLSSYDKDLISARDKVYAKLSDLNNTNLVYRKDIGR